MGATMTKYVLVMLVGLAGGGVSAMYMPVDLLAMIGGTVRPSGYIGPIDSIDTPIRVEYGVFPQARLLQETTATVDMAGREMEMSSEVTGRMWADEAHPGVIWTIAIDHMDIDAGGHRMNQPVDLLVEFTMSDRGRPMNFEVTGMGQSFAANLANSDQFSQFFAGELPSSGLSEGDLITQVNIDLGQILDGVPARVSGSATVVGQTVYEGRRALVVDMPGRLVGSGARGTFEGYGLLDVESGVWLASGSTGTISMAQNGQEMSMDIEHSTRLAF